MSYIYEHRITGAVVLIMTTDACWKSRERMKEKFGVDWEATYKLARTNGV